MLNSALNKMYDNFYLQNGYKIINECILFNTLKKLGLLLYTAETIKFLGVRLEVAVKKYRYSKNKKNFNIMVDDDNFHMSFADYDLVRSVQERIDGIREPETTSIIKSILRPSDNVLEIGGCYGYFTMLMANAVGPLGKVVSIEGLPNNFEILKKNIQLNKYKNIQLYNYFVGNSGNKIEFRSNDKSPYLGIERYKNKLLKRENYENTVSVECINIPEFLKQITFDPKYIFMDIEGFEVDVIEQLSEKYLVTKSPILVFEHHERRYDKNKGLKYIRELLTNNGYMTRKVYGNMIAFKE